MTTYNCGKCGSELANPETNDDAAYVATPDVPETHTYEQLVAELLTESGLEKRQRIMDHHNLDKQYANMAICNRSEKCDCVDLTDEDFEHVEVDERPKGLDECVGWDEVEKTVERPSRQIVCTDCISEEDEIIWD